MATLPPTKQAFTTSEMLEYAGLSRAGLHRARTAPDSDFPEPYVLPVAPHRNLWSRAEIDAWIERHKLPSLFAEPKQLRGSRDVANLEHHHGAQQ